MLTIIDFWAEWCGPCKMMDPVLDEILKELGDKIELVKKNVDEEHEEASKYGILSIPTYVIMKDGQEVDRIIGFTQKDNFIDKVKKHLG